MFAKYYIGKKWQMNDLNSDLSNYKGQDPILYIPTVNLYRIQNNVCYS